MTLLMLFNKFLKIEKCDILASYKSEVTEPFEPVKRFQIKNIPENAIWENVIQANAIWANATWANVLLLQIKQM